MEGEKNKHMYQWAFLEFLEEMLFKSLCITLYKLQWPHEKETEQMVCFSGQSTSIADDPQN